MEQTIDLTRWPNSELMLVHIQVAVVAVGMER
jgi:hypothetical protein